MVQSCKPKIKKNGKCSFSDCDPDTCKYKFQLAGKPEKLCKYHDCREITFEDCDTTAYNDHSQEIDVVVSVDVDIGEASECLIPHLEDLTWIEFEPLAKAVVREWGKRLGDK